MSKLLSQGGFGCVYHPRINCKGESTKESRIVTKIQKKTFQSDNEIRIGEIIKKIPGYSNRFIPVVNHCNVNIKEVTTPDLNKCKVIKKNPNHKDYVSMDLEYLSNITIDEIFEKKSHKDALLFIYETYRFLLRSLSLLNDNNIVHYDFKLSNIVFSKKTHNPYIIDFGISIPKKFLNSITYKKYFYLYSPSYYVWCIDIHVINYLLRSDSNIFQDKHIDIIVDPFIENNKPIHLISDKFANIYKLICKKYLKKFVGQSKENVIQTLLGYSDTWDCYSLSLMMIVIIYNKYNKKLLNSRLKKTLTLIIRNILPDKRLNATKSLNLLNTY